MCVAKKNSCEILKRELKKFMKIFHSFIHTRRVVVVVVVGEK